MEESGTKLHIPLVLKYFVLFPQKLSVCGRVSLSLYQNKVMETKAKINVILSSEASDFLEGLNSKIREKIIYNIRKSTYTIDPELFKKLDDTDI